MVQNRKTIIYGNGLGMALNSAHFSLESGLKAAWGECGEHALSEEDKKRIIQCVENATIGGSGPSSEEELALLQDVLTACDTLNAVGDSKIAWLTPDVSQFPQAVRKYFGRAASHFLNSNLSLPDALIGDLKEEVLTNRSHVATLNYDDLIYYGFCGTDVFKGFRCMIDGFGVEGFCDDNLDRFQPNQQCYYLHLHGSPLYVEEGEGVRKCSVGSLPRTHEYSKHLILTHHNYKKKIISQSLLLSAYWKRLREGIEESSVVYLIGYSGADLHLNSLITECCKRTEISCRIVEWAGSGKHPERSRYWRDLIGVKVDLMQLDSILEFRFSMKEQGDIPEEHALNVEMQ